MSAWLMKCLVPLMTQPPPSRRALVVIDRTSEPAPGSVMARQSMPLTADRRQQIRLHLAAPAGLQDVARPGNQRLQRVRRPPQLALGQRQRQRVEAAAAELGREVRGVQAGRDGLAADLARQLVAAPRPAARPGPRAGPARGGRSRAPSRRSPAALRRAEVHGRPSAASPSRRMPMTCPTDRRPGQRGMGLADRRQPVVEFLRHRDHPAARHVDMHQQLLRGRHGLAAGLVKQRDGTGGGSSARHRAAAAGREPVAERRLAQVMQMRLGGVEGVARGPVGLVDADVPEEGVGGVAHQQQIAGLAHVAVVVDPVRRDRGLDRAQAARRS